MIPGLLCALPARARGQEPPGATAQDDARPAAERIRELAELGRSQRGQGELDRSIETFERARAIAREADEPRTEIQLESEIVTTLDRQGRVEAILETLERIEALLDVVEDPVYVAEIRVHVLADRAKALLRSGRASESLEEARRATDLLDSTRSPAARGAACNVLGQVLLVLGRATEARAWFQRALDESEALEPGDRRHFEASMALARCLGELGDRRGALAIAESLVDEVETSPRPPFAAYLAYVLRGTLRFYDDWSGSEADLRKAIDRLEAAGVKENSNLHILARLELAHAIRNAGRPRESAEIERGELARARELLGPAHPNAIRALQFLAGSTWDLSRAEHDPALVLEARRLYEEAARLARSVSSPETFTIDACLGELLLEDLGDAAEAEAPLRAAVDEIEARSARSASVDQNERADLLWHDRLFKRDDPYEGLLACLVRLGRPGEALDVLERSRARSLADLLGRTRFDPLEAARRRAEAAGDTRAAARIRALPGDLDAAYAELVSARGIRDETVATARRREAQERIDRLERERADLSRDATPSGRIASAETVRACLGPGEVLLAYFVGAHRSWACLAEGPGGSVDWYPLADSQGRPLAAADIEPLTRAWVGLLSRAAEAPARGEAVRGPAPVSGHPDRLGRSLFHALVPDALWARLVGCERVHLLPHGPLNWLPFEALVVEEGQGEREPTRWIDAGPPVAYHESGTALVWSQSRRDAQRATPRPGIVLIVADPDYDADRQRPSSTQPGPVIVRVPRGGPAARSGIVAGDVVLAVLGERAGSAAEVARLLGEDNYPLALALARRDVARQVLLEEHDPGIEVADTPEVGTMPAPGGGERLPRLPGTAREAEAVRDALVRGEAGACAGLSAVRLLEGPDASETLLEAWAPSASILHIAAHQVDDPEGTSDAGRLALTPPSIPTPEDDGFVGLDDLLLHWRGALEGCELAVLSSCWSRTGRLERDEGFFGLPFGLRYAGCPSILSSLWPVDDEAAAELMSLFYARACGRNAPSRADAFHEAMRTMKKAHPDPYVWAAFVWTGSTR